MTQDAIPSIPLNPDMQYEDYWGTDETYRYTLPDGKQYFDIKPMNEGDKAKFQKKTNRGLRMNQRTQDATWDVDPAGDRWALIKDSVVGWLIMQKDPGAEGGWSEYPCPADDTRRARSVEQLLEKFNPKVVQDLEFFIRTKNPWMQADMNVEEIEEEIRRNQILLQQKKDEDAGRFFRDQVDLFVRGKEIPPPVLPEIRLFNLCEGMKWAHLPMPGGIYDQSPKLIDRFHYIFIERSKHQEVERKKRESSQMSRPGRGGGVGGSRASY